MKPARFFPLIVLLLSPLLFHIANAQSKEQLVNERVEEFIGIKMTEQHIPGLSIAVIRDRKILKMQGYGVADIATGTPATAETVYKIASVSKQFIASAIMLLHQEGKINLDAPVNSFCDSFPPLWKQITIRHLLTHTSGLVRDIPGYSPVKVRSNTEAIRQLFNVPLQFVPGEKYQYSNAGYCILAEIVQRLSGMPWDDFIRDHIFIPAGMSQTRTTTEAEIIPFRANGYKPTATGFEKVGPQLVVRPSGAFLSSVIDLARWDSVLYTKSILTNESKQLMWTPVTLNNGKTYSYGFGWTLGSIRGHQRVMHNGSLPGFKSGFLRYPKDHLTVIVLTNSTDAVPLDIALKIAGFYMPVLEPLPKAAAAPDPSLQ
jgi:CubicO group peptidase (beta-lactamase class C family)